MPTSFVSNMLVVSGSLFAAMVAVSPRALAADVPTQTTQPASNLGLNAFFSGVEYHLQGEAGILGNSSNPTQGSNGEGYNFGQLYEDHANEPQLNQLLLTITKPVDAAAAGYAFGFVLQGLYGSDMRFNHFLGIGDQFLGSQRNQLNIVQGYVAAHLPIFTSGGVDLRVGLFQSPQGNENLDASTNPLYTHSYTYYDLTTFNHTGIFTTTHINSTFDLIIGVDTGEQTSIGFPGGDQNGQIAGFVGFGLNHLLDDKLTVYALSHIGPEQNFVADPIGANRDLRYYNDVYLTYKISDAITSVTELNYTRDEFGVGNGPATAYSIVQDIQYSFGKIYTLTLRAEALRDSQNFYIATFQDNSGTVKSEHGTFPFIAPTIVAPNGLQGTTYGDLTLGLTIKPDVPKPLALVMLRPEIRYDRVLAGGAIFNNNISIGGLNTGSRNQFTFGGDVIIGF